MGLSCHKLCFSSPASLSLFFFWQVNLPSFTLSIQERKDVEGTLFLVERASPPHFVMFIMNRLNLANFIEPITEQLELRTSNNFALAAFVVDGHH